MGGDSGIMPVARDKVKSPTECADCTESNLIAEILCLPMGNADLFQLLIGVYRMRPCRRCPSNVFCFG